MQKSHVNVKLIWVSQMYILKFWIWIAQQTLLNLYIVLQCYTVCNFRWWFLLFAKQTFNKTIYITSVIKFFHDLRVKFILTCLFHQNLSWLNKCPIDIFDTVFCSTGINSVPFIILCIDSYFFKSDDFVVV